MIILLLAVALAAGAPPSGEALALGRQLAEQGTLASLLPLIKAKEIEELVDEDPGLDEAGRSRLRALAESQFERGHDRLMAATGAAYGERLSVEDLRVLVRAQAHPAAARFRASTPDAIAAAMSAVGQLDFKGDVRAAFCAETGRLCPRP